MTTQQIRTLLIHAVTAYDARAAKRRGHNPHALGIYFQRIDEVIADIERGATPRRALCAGFQDRLLDHCLKAIGEAPFKPEELGNDWFYSPSSDKATA